MTHSLEFDSEAQILRGTAKGPASVQGFHAYTEALAEHPDFDRCAGVINDYRGVEGSSLSPQDIRSLALHAASFADRWAGRPGALLVSGQLAFGLSRVSGPARKSDLGFRMLVCHTVAEAEAFVTAHARYDR